MFLHGGRKKRKTNDRPSDRTNCPHCGAELDPLPKAKKACPTCGEPIYVRSGPDGRRHLLLAEDVAVIEQQWADHYGAINAAEDAATNRMAAKASRFTLNAYRKDGVRQVVLIGAADACPARAALTGQPIPIADAGPIPVAGSSSRSVAATGRRSSSAAIASSRFLRSR